MKKEITYLLSYRFYCLLGVFICLTYALQAQNHTKVDSLKQQLATLEDPLDKIEVLNLLSQEYLNYLSDEGIKYSQEALELSIEYGHLRDIAETRELLGKHYFRQQKYVLALTNFEKTIKNYESISDLQSYWNCKREIGLIFYETGDFTQALKIFFDVLKFYESENDSDGAATVLNNIGILYHRQMDPTKAIEFYTQALTILENNNKTKDHLYARLQTNLGLSYLALEEFEKAEKCYLKSLEINNDIGNERIYTVNIGNLAAVYAKMGDYKKAENYFIEAIESSKKMKDRHSEAVNYGDIGNLYLDMSQTKELESEKGIYLNYAIDYFQRALELLMEFNDLRNYQFFSRNLSEAYELKGDYRKALEVYRTHITYKDSVFNDDINREFTKREIEHEYSKREDAIRIENEKEIAVKDALLAVNRNQKWMLLLGVFLLSIIGVMLFYQSHSRKKHNQKLSKLNEELNQANQIKARFFSILTHDLRSPISNVVRFLRFRQESTIELDEKTQNRLEAKTVDSAENLLKSMEDLLLWSKGQLENFEPEFMEVRIDEIFEEFETFYRYQSDVTIQFILPKDFIIETDPDYLKTIIRNLTSNALKALENQENATIIWKAFEKEGKKIISITDNGSGGYPEQFRALYDETHTVGIQTGLGLHLVRDMAQAIHCTLEVETELDKGTTMFLIFG